MKRELHIITDLQFGSTGKGLLAGYLALSLKPDTVVAAWGPNAGHTFIDAHHVKMVNIMLPNGIVSANLKRVMIGPGAVIHPELFMSELERYAALLMGVDVLIHENACVVHERHREQEAGYGGKIGSTMKGVGAAMMEKIKRDPDGGKIIARDALKGTPLEGLLATDYDYALHFDKAEKVLVEGAQGFSLSLNHGPYPYVTSRNCTTSQILSDCAIPCYGWTATVYGVARTYPIRVNNRTGWSGPCYPDQAEISWQDLGVEPELTTVTKLPRRIFTFSHEQVRAAVRMNGVDKVFLNFCNYLDTQNGPDANRQAAIRFSERIWHECRGNVRYLGWGPKVSDIEEVRI